MWILGIETSDRAGAIALARDAELVEERALPSGGRRHAQSLVAEIGRLLRDHRLARAECVAVAVSIGPGSFTGLRVGVVCAKTFAYATGCRIAAVDTLACIAENAPPDVGDVWIIADAQRGELYAARYLCDGSGIFRRDGEVVIVEGPAWSAERGADDVVSGPGVQRFETELAGRCRVLEPELRHPRAATVARLGWATMAAGGGDDLWKLEPLYIRRSAAEEKWDAQHPSGPVQQREPQDS